MYATKQIWIQPGHRLFKSIRQLAENSKNLFNTTNFYIRQIYTALQSEKCKPLHPLQQEVMNQLRTYLPIMNQTQRMAYEKRLARELKRPPEERKEVRLTLFDMPTKETSFVSYEFVDALFKAMNHPDYRALPAHTAQGTMKNVFQNWKSFFQSLKDYREHPHKYQARPRIPNYKQGTEKEVIISNQEAKIQDGRFLKLPKIKTRLSIGKLGTSGTLKQIRIVPRNGRYVLELVMEDGLEVTVKADNGRYIGIDLGIDNLMALTSNTGMKPILVKGTKLKSLNQFFNKRLAHYRSILRHGQPSHEGVHTSHRLRNLHHKRSLRMKDFLHKASFHAVKIAVEEGAKTIVIGQNKGWKQKSSLGKRQNQSFYSIPHHMFIEMIRYKAERAGINVITTEEAYTSQSSFLDADPIPEFSSKEKPRFSGRRIKRGLYRASCGTLINADINGSLNILRKVCPNAFQAKGLAGLCRKANVSTPQVLSIA